MRLFLLLAILSSLPLAAQKKANKRKPEPFQWNNPLPEKFEKLGVLHGTYESKINRASIGYNILLPKVYADEPTRRFPVVYLLHGGRPGSESKILNVAPFVTKAISEKLIPPTIYVFVNGGPMSHYDYPGVIKNLDEGVGKKGNSTLVKELIPHIDLTYRSIAKRKGRILEGYSQGGRGTLRAAFRNPELFAAASAGSAGVATELRIQENEGTESDHTRFTQGDDAYTLAKQYAENKKESFPLKLFLYTGDTKKDFNWEGNVAYSNYLDSIKIAHRHLLIPDCPHSASKAYAISSKDLFTFLAPILKNASDKTK